MPNTTTPAADRLAILDVQVVDWAEVGDWYEVQTEDGPRARAPEHALHVTVEDARGERFVYCGPASPSRHVFPSGAAAERFRDRVAERGTIDLTHWAYWRTVYGSTAYVLDGHEDAQVERERLDAGVRYLCW